MYKRTIFFSFVQSRKTIIDLVYYLQRKNIFLLNKILKTEKKSFDSVSRTKIHANIFLIQTQKMVSHFELFSKLNGRSMKPSDVK